MQLPQINIILISPQMGENIGAAARAMKNFGCSKLRIVNPRDGWPNPKSYATATHANDILSQAKLYNNLDSAISDMEYLYATTSVMRNMNKDYILSNNLNKELVELYKSGINKIGILFGRESSGLSNTEIMLANKILTIPTAEFSSLNISHAVGIICYEILQNQTIIPPTNMQEVASKAEMQYFLNHLFTTLEEKNFFKISEKKDLMLQNIVNIFTRIDKLSKTEVQTLRGIISSYVRNSEK